MAPAAGGEHGAGNLRHHRQDSIDQDTVVGPIEFGVDRR